jgi:NTE family protein
MTHKKVGLALSGGGARGFAHIGVLQVLVENKIPIDLIAGSSAGSVIGGAFAAGLTPEQLSDMGAQASWMKMTRPSLSPLGFLSNAPMGKFLERHLPTTRFEDLKVPFGAVAYDLDGGARILLKEAGDLITAIRASCAIPGIFAPVQDSQGRLLVDGGVVCPTPAEDVRAMGSDIVIAVDLISCGAAFRSRPRTALGIMFQSAMALLRAASASQCYDADIVIVPEIAHVRPDQMAMRNELIQLGRAAAEAALPSIEQRLMKA